MTLTVLLHQYDHLGATLFNQQPNLNAGNSNERLVGGRYVFQRTPSSIESLTAGWQRERMDNFNTLVSGRPGELDL